VKILPVFVKENTESVGFGRSMMQQTWKHEIPIHSFIFPQVEESFCKVVAGKKKGWMPK
jgi:hypothetical protein